MHIAVTFRHMEATDALKEYAREKLEKIKKYFPDPISAHVVMTTERGYQHNCDVNIQLHNGLTIKGTEVTEDMYSSIDLVMAKIERQVRRYKEKIRGHKARADLSSIPVAYHVLGRDSDSDTETSPQPPNPAVEQPKRTVIRTEHLSAQPLSVDEAIMQMNLLGMTFLAFRNAQSGHVNVVYKREDGNYGLIETNATATPVTAHP